MSGHTPGPAEFALALVLLGAGWFLISSVGHPWLGFAILFGALVLAEEDARAANIPGPLAEAHTALASGTLSGPVLRTLPGAKVNS